MRKFYQASSHYSALPAARNLRHPGAADCAETDADLNPGRGRFRHGDMSGVGGDALAMASVGAHMLAVVTGAYARDTAEIFDHFAFDEEAVAEQARAILEDVEVQLIKVGFVGSPEYYFNPQKGQGNAAKWVARAYLDVLFRPATVGEVNDWLQFLGAG